MHVVIDPGPLVVAAQNIQHFGDRTRYRDDIPVEKKDVIALCRLNKLVPGDGLTQVTLAQHDSAVRQVFLTLAKKFGRAIGRAVVEDEDFGFAIID